MIDYMVLEAIVLRTKLEDSDAQKDAEKKNWKKDRSSLESHR